MWGESGGVWFVAWSVYVLRTAEKRCYRIVSLMELILQSSPLFFGWYSLKYLKTIYRKHHLI